MKYGTKMGKKLNSYLQIRIIFDMQHRIVQYEDGPCSFTGVCLGVLQHFLQVRF